MKFFGIAAFIGALVTITSAAPTLIADDPDATKFYITAPLEANTYAAGDVLTTEWNNGVPGAFKLELLKGAKASSMQDTRIPFANTDGSTGSYKWQIPSDIPAGVYAFHYVYNGGESYSPQFKITSGAGSSNTQAHTEPKTDATGAGSSNTQAHTEPKTDTTGAPPANGSANTHAQTPAQSTAGKPSGSTMTETVNRVPQQQVPSQQRQAAQHGATTDNETGRS